MTSAPTPDVLVAKIVRTQAGVVSRDQALNAGLSKRQVQHRLRTGRWVSLLPGIHLLNSAQVTWTTWAWAGTLSGGEGCVLVGGSAAALRTWSPQEWPITVAVPPGRRMRWPSSRLLSCRLEVPPSDVVRVNGLPVTSRVRTAVDIAHLMPLQSAQQLLDRILVLGVVDLDGLAAAVEPSRRHGSRQARRLLRSAGDRAASEAERMAQVLLRSAGLDGFVANFPTEVAGRPIKIDLAFVQERVAIEVKGWAFHSLPDRGRSDAEREADLQLAGWLVITVTWFDLVSRPDYVVDRVRDAIARRSVA
jgi:very-short-patch-repair endonuclease